jgi:nitrite reductase/ring-hydroxylating ferredoxin subunit
MSCDNACGTHPELRRDASRASSIEVDAVETTHLNRRNLLKAFAAGLGAIGLSSAASSAMAAAVATPTTYTITNARTDKFFPGVGGGARYVVNIKTLVFDDGGNDDSKESKKGSGSSNGGGTSMKVVQTPILVTQPKAGVYRAFNGWCTHQMAPITKINGSNLVCAAHGANFDTTTGANSKGPQNFGNKKVPALRSYPITVDPKTGNVTIVA